MVFEISNDGGKIYGSKSLNAFSLLAETLNFIVIYLKYLEINYVEHIFEFI